MGICSWLRPHKPVYQPVYPTHPTYQDVQKERTRLLKEYCSSQLDVSALADLCFSYLPEGDILLDLSKDQYRELPFHLLFTYLEEDLQQGVHIFYQHYPGLAREVQNILVDMNLDKKVNLDHVQEGWAQLMQMVDKSPDVVTFIYEITDCQTIKDFLDGRPGPLTSQSFSEYTAEEISETLSTIHLGVLVCQRLIP